MPMRKRIAICDVRGVAADAVTVNALARFQLAAGRRGFRVRLRNTSAEFRELVSFMGLTDVLPADDFSPPVRSNPVQPSTPEV